MGNLKSGIGNPEDGGLDRASNRNSGPESRHKVGRYALTALVPVVILVLPLVVHSDYITSIMVVIALYACMALGLCLLMGYAGQVSLGQAAFYAIGAYTSGILTATYHVNPWLALLVAIVLTGILAGVTGGLLLRFRGHVLAVATLALNIIVTIVLTEWDSLTGGASPGLSGIPHLSIDGFHFSADIHYYYLAWVVAGLFFVISYNVVHSRVGRALRSLHQFYGGSEEAAESLGVNSAILKVQVFILAGVFAGVAGSIYAHWVTFLSPDPFGIMLSLELLVMVILGGLRSLAGAVLGAGIVVALGEVLREVIPLIIPNAFGQYQIMAYGAILIVVLILLPEGLVDLPGGLQRLRHRLTRVALQSNGPSALDVEG